MTHEARAAAEFAPTTAEVRQRYVVARMQDADRDGEPVMPTRRFWDEFDGWLAAERAAGVAEGIRQAREAVAGMRRYHLASGGLEAMIDARELGEAMDRL